MSSEPAAIAPSILFGSGPLKMISIDGASFASTADNWGSKITSTKSVPMSEKLRWLLDGSKPTGVDVICSTIAIMRERQRPPTEAVLLFSGHFCDGPLYLGSQ